MSGDTLIQKFKKEKDGWTLTTTKGTQYVHLVQNNCFPIFGNPKNKLKINRIQKRRKIWSFTILKIRICISMCIQQVFRKEIVNMYYQSIFFIHKSINIEMTIQLKNQR